MGLYERKCREEEIDGKFMEVWTAEFWSCCNLTAEVGTNGFGGGDSGHGGRAVLRFEGDGDFRVVAHDTKAGRKVEIIVGGDCEIRQLVESLEFSLEVLKEQLKKNP